MDRPLRYLLPPGGRGTAAAGACDPQRPGGRTGGERRPGAGYPAGGRKACGCGTGAGVSDAEQAQRYVTTLSDERGRKTAAELVADCGRRVFPVGRLDKDSEGLLLFTNDGTLAQQLLHPRHQVDKVYQVTVSGALEGPRNGSPGCGCWRGSPFNRHRCAVCPKKGRRRCWR